MDSPAPLLAHGRPVVRRHRASLSACLVVLTLVAAACGDDDTDDPVGPEPAGVGFEADVQPIFDLRCTQACHSPPTLNGNLDLSPGASHAGLVGVPADGYADRIRVVPGEPDSSLLYLKLIGDPDVGNRMPLFGSLDSLRITTIRTWIEDGARDD